MNNLRTISQTSEPESAIEGVDIQLVEKMLSLQKECQSVKPEEDLDKARSLDRQIRSADEEIDKRVYALYGLTGEEIKIIEGR
jgi:hypothetical protein